MALKSIDDDISLMEKFYPDQYELVRKLTYQIKIIEEDQQNSK